ncbi:MAG: hypothetical protein ACRDQV_16995 [Pseudonocardiaceae bacterium]
MIDAQRGGADRARPTFGEVVDGEPGLVSHAARLGFVAGDAGFQRFGCLAAVTDDHLRILFPAPVVLDQVAGEQAERDALTT